MRKALARLVALLARHSQPALGAVRKRLLARGWQAVPLPSILRQQLLLLGGKTRPGDRGRGIGARGGGFLRKRRRCHKQQGKGARTPCVTHYFSLPLCSAAATVEAGLPAVPGPWPPAPRAADRPARGSPGSTRRDDRRFPGTRESPDPGPRAAACACRRC